MGKEFLKYIYIFNIYYEKFQACTEIRVNPNISITQMTKMTITQ